MHSAVVLPLVGWLWLAGLALLGLLGFGVRRHHFEAAGLAFGAGLIAFAWICQRRDRPSGSALHGPASIRVYAIPAVVALAAFGWSTTLGPLSDDFVLRRWAVAGDWDPDAWPFLRPLPLALWSGAAVAGGGWIALHGFNVLLHALNSALVGRLAATRLGTTSGTVAGALFATFPASPEAVAWTAGVFDLVATACVLAAIAVAPRAVRSIPWTIALLLVCAAGLLSKESAVIIPGLLLLDLMLTGRPGRLLSERGMPVLLTLALTVAYVVARLLLSPAVAAHLQELPSGRRQLKDLVVKPFAALAVPLRTDGGTGPEFYVVGLLVLALIALVVIRIAAADTDRADPYRVRAAASLNFGMGWIMLSALPLLLEFHVSPSLEGSRFLYFPCVGFAVALSAAFTGRWRSDGVACAVAICLLAIYAFSLNQERHVWREAAALRDRVLAAAETLAGSVPCATLTLQDAPDNHRGAYVFREGLAEALAGVPMVPAGHDCEARWSGSALIF